MYKTISKEITYDTNEKRYRAKLPFKDLQQTIVDNFKNSEKGFSSAKRRFDNFGIY